MSCEASVQRITALKQYALLISLDLDTESTRQLATRTCLQLSLQRQRCKTPKIVPIVAARACKVTATPTNYNQQDAKAGATRHK